ncbi:MAG: hypothetical protein V1917_01465, partial [Candidatus Gottesmanbacteria bacterium]
PIFSFVSGSSVFIAARLLMFGVFTGLSIIVGLLFWEVRRSWIAIVAPLILLFLPMPSDKLLEIRPDTLTTLFFFLGLLFQMRGMNLESKNHSKKDLLFSGICYGLSLFVSQKMVLFLVIPIGGYVGWGIMNMREKLISFQRYIAMSVWGLVGFFSMIAILFGYFLSIGAYPLIWYSLTTLGFEAGKLGNIFATPIQFYFLPNDIYYGVYGYHLGYILNLICWMCGILVCIVRIFSPYVPHRKQGVWQEIILGALLLLSISMYIWFWPMKHAQYLIPSAVLIAYYCADFVYIIWERMKQKWMAACLFLILFLSVLFLFVRGYQIVTMPKLWWRNEGDLKKLERILQVIPKTEPIFDMVGLTVYYPQPYYIAVFPVGQVTSVISLSVPSLISKLEETNTKFIYIGYQARFQTLSHIDQEYIQTHFSPMGDGSLLVRNDIVDTYKNLWSQEQK